MRGGFAVVLLVACVGCGRIGFNDAPDAAPHVDAGLPPVTSYTRLLTYGTNLTGQTSSLSALFASRFVSVMQSADSTALDDTLLEGVDFIVIEDLAAMHTTSEATALASWILGGGALFVTSGWLATASDQANYDTLFAELPFQLEGPLMSGVVTQFTTHPVTTGITSLPFNGGYTVKLAASGTATSLGVATLPPSVVAGVIELGPGRIVVWGDEWISFDSQWNGDVPTFWSNAITWLVHQS